MIRTGCQLLNSASDLMARENHIFAVVRLTLPCDFSFEDICRAISLTLALSHAEETRGRGHRGLDLRRRDDEA